MKDVFESMSPEARQRYKVRADSASTTPVVSPSDEAAADAAEKRRR